MDAKDSTQTCAAYRKQIGVAQRIEIIKNYLAQKDETQELKLLPLLGDLVIEAIKSDDNDDAPVGIFKELALEGKISEDQIIEIFWLCDIEIDRLEIDDPEKLKGFKQSLSYLITDLEKDGVLSKDKLMVRLSAPLLGECGLTEPNSFQRRILRIRTKNIYEQNKYNLYREESEGYTKLNVFLLGLKDSSHLSTVIQNINSLIGYFDLDPNRVIDIILECYMNNHYNDVYAEILKEYKREYLPHILGFKYQKYSSTTDCSAEIEIANKSIKDIQSDKTITPENLYRVTAKLIKRGLVELEDIWAHLSPADELIQTEFERRNSSSFESIKSVFCPVLTFKSESIEREQANRISLRNYLGSQYLRNQKIWLLEALLKQNDYVDFKRCYSAIGDYIDLNSHGPLQTTMIDFLDWFIEPLYRQISPTIFSNKKTKNAIFEVSSNPEIGKKELPRPKAVSLITFLESSDELETVIFSLKQITELLRYVKCNIGANSVTFTKLCRLLVAIYKRIKEQDNKGAILEEFKPKIKEIRGIIYNLLKDSLIPSLPGLDSVPSIVSYVWSLMKWFNYFERYQIYELWFTKNLYPNPQVMQMIGETLSQTVYFLKTVSTDKKIDKINARIFAKLTHNCPIVVFYYVLQQLKSFRNLIPVIIASLNYCSKFSLDVITFLVLRSISKKGEKVLREDEGTLKSDFSNLTYFMGLLLKKHYKIDLEGIFIFLGNKLCSDSFHDHLNIILFNEILAWMSGYETFQNFTDMQLNSLAGGIGLQTEAFKLTDQVRSAKKSSKALADFFWKSEGKVLVYGDSGEEYLLSLPFYLISMISQQKNRLLYSSGFKNPVAINFLYDKMNESLFQFSLFLKYHSDSHAQYLELLPPNALELLMVKFKVSPELAFQVVRMGFKPINKLIDTKWKELVQQFVEIFEKFDYAEFYKITGVENDLMTPKIIESRKSLWKTVSPDLYTLFWVLQAGHINVPKEAYSNQIGELKKEIALLESSKERTDSKILKTIDRIKKGIVILQQEELNLQKEKDKIHSFIEAHKTAILNGFSLEPQKLVPFSQFCLLPRLRLSPEDAIYCSRIVDYLLDLNKVSFKKRLEAKFELVYLILPCLQCCSESESYNVGVFLKDILKFALDYHSDSQFEAEVTKVNKIAGTKTSLGYNDLLKLKHKIISSLEKLTKMITPLLDAGNFIESRNIVIIVNHLREVYPSTKEMAETVLLMFEKKFKDDTAIKDSIDTQIKSYKATLKMKIETLPSIDLKQLKAQMNGEKGAFVAPPRHSESSKSRTTAKDTKEQDKRHHHRSSKDRKKSQARTKDVIEKKSKKQKLEERKKPNRDSKSRHMTQQNKGNPKRGDKQYIDKRGDISGPKNSRSNQDAPSDDLRDLRDSVTKRIKTGGNNQGSTDNKKSDKKKK